MAGKHRPQRTCVACRQKKDKRRLTRLVFADAKLRIDESGKRDGRGAYLCDSPICWEQAAARPMIDKALRVKLSHDDRAYLQQMKPGRTARPAPNGRPS